MDKNEVSSKKAFRAHTSKRVDKNGQNATFSKKMFQTVEKWQVGQKMN